MGNDGGMIWIVVLLLVLVVGFLLLRSAGRKRALVTAIVEIPASGAPSVSITPEGSNPQDLIQLLLSYGTKLRWVLNSEPPRVRGMFQELVGELIDVWPVSGEHGPLRMSGLGQLFSELEGRRQAVAGGERFTVHLHRFADGEGYVINHLAVPGLAANVSWHYILLADAIYKRLDQTSRDLASSALAAWWDVITSSSADDSSLSALTALNRLANAALREASSR